MAFLYVIGSADSVFYGVNDRANEGTWVCNGTGQTIATATGPGTGGPLFHSSQPYRPDGKDGDCINGRRPRDFLFADASCMSSKLFLCEKP